MPRFPAEAGPPRLFAGSFDPRQATDRQRPAIREAFPVTHGTARLQPFTSRGGVSGLCRAEQETLSLSFYCIIGFMDFWRIFYFNLILKIFLKTLIQKRHRQGSVSPGFSG